MAASSLRNTLIYSVFFSEPVLVSQEPDNDEVPDATEAICFPNPDAMKPIDLRITEALFELENAKASADSLLWDDTYLEMITPEDLEDLIV